MRDHYHSPITNRQLARLAHRSVRAFERKFQGSLHLTPQKYLRKLQMLMARRALVYTQQPLADVAVGCGFSGQSHFTREFRRDFGRTPRGIPRASRTRRRRRRSCHKTCRWRAIFDLADAVTKRPLGRSRWGSHSGAGTCGNASAARPAAIGDRANEQ
jgi:AraC-like DNA-binding protein